MSINILSLLLFIFGILHFIIAGIISRRRSAHGAKSFSLLLIFVAIYSIGYGLELASQNLENVLFWTNIEYIGICPLAPLYLIFAVQYVGQDRWLTRRNLIALFTFPAFVFVAKWTDGFHQLMYRNPALDTSGPIPLLTFERGILYYINAVFIFCVIFSGIILILIKRRIFSEIFRRQSTLMILTSCAPLLVYLYYASGIQLFPFLKNIDLNPFAMMVLEIGISWVMLRYNLFDVAPIAREALIENMCDGVVVLDDQSRLVDINPAAQRIFGVNRQIVGKTVDVLWREYPDLAAACANPVKNTTEFHITGKSSGFYEANFSVLSNTNGPAIGQLVVLRDITIRKEYERELQKAKEDAVQAKEEAEEANLELRKAWADMERIAATDKLTGAFNRRKFEEISIYELSRAERYLTPLSLIMLDIDHFKQINDEFGHQSGDEILMELTRIIASHTRNADSLVRWGGEEFLIVAPGIHIDQASQLAEKIRKLVEGYPFPVPQRITVSLGVTQYRERDTIDSMISRADDAVYRAKNNGRNRVELG